MTIKAAKEAIKGGDLKEALELLHDCQYQERRTYSHVQFSCPELGAPTIMDVVGTDISKANDAALDLAKSEPAMDLSKATVSAKTEDDANGDPTNIVIDITTKIEEKKETKTEGVLVPPWRESPLKGESKKEEPKKKELPLNLNPVPLLCIMCPERTNKYCYVLKGDCAPADSRCVKTNGGTDSKTTENDLDPTQVDIGKSWPISPVVEGISPRTYARQIGEALAEVNAFCLHACKSEVCSYDCPHWKDKQNIITIPLKCVGCEKIDLAKGINCSYHNGALHDVADACVFVPGDSANVGKKMKEIKPEVIAKRKKGCNDLIDKKYLELRKKEIGMAEAWAAIALEFPRHFMCKDGAITLTEEAIQGRAYFARGGKPKFEE